MNEVPISEAIAKRRQEAIVIAQQILPIVLQAEMGKVTAESLTKDTYLEGIEGADDAVLPDPRRMAAYALQIGTEFITQAYQLVEAPIPGMTGTT